MTDEAFPTITNVADLFSGQSLPPKRFPLPWSVEAHTESYIIVDADSKPLGYVYFVGSPRRTNHNSLTRDEAWNMATNIANLANLMMETK